MAFSILERIDVGETIDGDAIFNVHWPFSILERIDVGETDLEEGGRFERLGLSVSSNGSTWVKPGAALHARCLAWRFQYPRTDRRG